MNVFIYICIVLILYLCFTYINIEGYEYSTTFNQNDLKFIPFSDSPYTNALNSYVIRAEKPRNPYLISSLLDANTSYDTHSMFQFPTNDPRKSVYNELFDIKKDYTQQFRPIITHDKNRNKHYNNEIILDQMKVNNPFEVEMDPKFLESKILYKPRDKYNTVNQLINDPKKRGFPRMEDYSETYEHDKYGNRFKCPFGFTLDKKKIHKLKKSNYRGSPKDDVNNLHELNLKDACILL
jgi:hypothetical protein